MNKIFTFKTSVYSGDLIYTLAGIKAACEKAEAKASIYLWLDKKGKPYEGATHPYGHSMLNEYVLKMMKPLIENQPYIHSLSEWKGEEIAVDLDDLRTKNVVGMPYGCVARWPFYMWPDMICDLSKSWLKVNSEFNFFYERILKQVSGKILINRTSRWRNEMINYWFMKRGYEKDLVFAGLPEEHKAFCEEWSMDIPLLEVNDFYDLAYAIASCKFLIGNQSMCFAIAEAMKTPRVLEICPYAPNVIPSGPHAYDFMHQFAFEWLIKDLNENIYV